MKSSADLKSGENSGKAIARWIIEEIKKDYSVRRKQAEALTEIILRHIRTDCYVSNYERSLYVSLVLSYGDKGDSTFSMKEFTGILEGSVKPSQKLLSENPLAWLIHQQGYALTDIFTDSSPFLNSVYSEIINFREDSAQLVVCCSANANELFAAGLHSKDGGPVRLEHHPRDTPAIGLYSPETGHVSLFDIAIERPLIIPKKLISEVQVEDSHRCSCDYKGPLSQFSVNMWEKTKIASPRIVGRNCCAETTLLECNFSADVRALKKNSQETTGLTIEL